MSLMRFTDEVLFQHLSIVTTYLEHTHGLEGYYHLGIGMMIVSFNKIKI